MQTAKSLKTWRIKRSFSQEDLFHLSGISVRTIQRLEKEQSNGSPYTLRTLAKALKIEIDDLFVEKNEWENQPVDAHLLSRMNLSALVGLTHYKNS